MINDDNALNYDITSLCTPLEQRFETALLSKAYVMQ